MVHDIKKEYNGSRRKKRIKWLTTEKNIMVHDEKKNIMVHDEKKRI